MDIIKSIEIFREVCKQMSFNRAASQLNLVPSAVSRQVNELEKHLGVRLLLRTTRSIRLSEEGKQYLQKMDKIIQSVDELKNKPSEEQAIQDHIRLTAPPILGTEILHDVLNKYLQEYPDVSLSVTLVNREINLIEEGYDIALRVSQLEDSNLVARTVGKFPLSVVASKSYIKTHGKPKHPKDLVKHNCIINTLTQTPRRWRFKEGKRNLSVKVKGQYDANDDKLLLSFVCTGLGIAYLPTYVVRDQINKGNLITLLQNFVVEPIPVSIVYPSRHFLSIAKQKLIEHFINHTQQASLSMDKY